MDTHGVDAHETITRRLSGVAEDQNNLPGNPNLPANLPGSDVAGNEVNSVPEPVFNVSQKASIATLHHTLHHKEKSKQLLPQNYHFAVENGRRGSAASRGSVASRASAVSQGSGASRTSGAARATGAAVGIDAHMDTHVDTRVDTRGDGRVGTGGIIDEGDESGEEGVTAEESKIPRWLTDNAATRFLQGPWTRMVVFCLACFFTTALHYGWQQYAQMLRRDGAYSWRCSADAWTETGECKAQEDAISAMYSIAAGCEYASAALGGIMLDHMGPRKTAFIGEITFMAGTVLLIIASQSAELYIPAMILLGSSVNVTAFPSLVTVETFPRWQGLMVALMLASETAATAIPIVLYAIMKAGYSFRTVWIGYLGFTWLPITIMYYTALPSNRDFTNMLKLQRTRLLQGKKDGKKDGKNDDKDEKDDAETTAVADKCESQVDIESVDEERLEYIPRSASWGEFAKNALTVDMIVMSVYFMILMMIFAYYPTVVRNAFGDDMSDFVGYVILSQGVTALLAGFICDIWPTATVMAGLSFFLCLCSVAFCFPQYTALQYVAAAVFNIVQPAVFEVKFTFVHEIFDPYNFGKLVGLLGVVGGIGTFFNIPMASLTDYTRVFAAYSITAGVLTAMALFLCYRNYTGITYRTMPDTKIKSDTKVQSVEIEAATAPATPEIVAH